MRSVAPLRVAIYLLALLPSAVFAQGMSRGPMAPNQPRKPTAREEFHDRVVLEGGPNYGPPGAAPMIVEAT
jgi:hypothetical protein